MMYQMEDGRILAVREIIADDDNDTLTLKLDRQVRTGRGDPDNILRGRERRRAMKNSRTQQACVEIETSYPRGVVAWINKRLLTNGWVDREGLENQPLVTEARETWS